MNMQLAEFLAHRLEIDQNFVDDCIALILEKNPEASVGDSVNELEQYLNADWDLFEGEITSFVLAHNVSLDLPLNKVWNVT